MEFECSKEAPGTGKMEAEGVVCLVAVSDIALNTGSQKYYALERKCISQNRISPLISMLFSDLECITASHKNRLHCIKNARNKFKAWVCD